MASASLSMDPRGGTRLPCSGCAQGSGLISSMGKAGASKDISQADVAEVPSKDSCLIEIDHVVDEPAPRPLITAVQAIAKGERGELAVQMLTETGIDVIVPWQAEHSIARWEGERGAKHRAKWQATAREAAKQSRRSWIPPIEPAVGTAAVADLIAERRHRAGAGRGSHHTPHLVGYLLGARRPPRHRPRRRAQRE